ncbi:MAG: hypothetical protein ACTSRK_02190 [Promethearchaeota archaeon]
MSTIRIDDEHQEMLDHLLAKLTLKGKKMKKKDFIGHLIEKATQSDAFLIDIMELPPISEDPAWIGLNKTFKLGYANLSESVDQELYKLDGED